MEKNICNSCLDKLKRCNIVGSLMGCDDCGYWWATREELCSSEKHNDYIFNNGVCLKCGSKNKN